VGEGEGVTVYIGGKRVGPPEPERPDRETIQDWIDRVTNEGRGLTPWETEFIYSVADQWDRRGDLTDPQIKILERIYAEKVR
jgi:hypothetical protein